MTRPDHATASTARWWSDAVIYQVYVRSFADSGTRGEPGVGDLPGITSRLPYLRDLGVDALWITPFYTSPQHDHGYDVADYTDVDPLFGTLGDADDLLAAAHDLGLKVIVDLVPNHTSSEHPWFQAALAAAPGSPERARYLFREGRGAGGNEPPNNWHSVFGGPAWTRVPADEGDRSGGQWYLHLFDTTQPDLDWRNPEVGDMFEGVLRFWLERGVDGFRVDVAHGLFKEESLRDQDVDDPSVHPGPDSAPQPAPASSMVERTLRDEPMWDQPEVHDVYRRWRLVLDEFSGSTYGDRARMDVAEAWTQTPESMARFVRDDEMDQAFNFAWLLAPWSAEAFAGVVADTTAALGDGSASPTWVLSNHDVVRHATRYAAGAPADVGPAVGLARARAATLTMLALHGASYLYQGEELGLPEVDVAPGDRQDPAWLRHRGGTGEVGRDGCRVPIPWSGDAAPYGFGPGTAQPWIPQPADWAGVTVEAQTGVEGSTLELYRSALALRRQYVGQGDQTVRADGDVLVVERGVFTAVLNCGTTPVALPDGEVLISSGPLEDRMLPPHTAAWVAP